MQNPSDYGAMLHAMGLDRPIEVIMLTSMRDGILEAPQEHVDSLEETAFKLALKMARKMDEPGDLKRKTFRLLASWDMEDLASRYGNNPELYK